jgi:hypothetical protein
MKTFTTKDTPGTKNKQRNSFVYLVSSLHCDVHTVPAQVLW